MKIKSKPDDLCGNCGHARKAHTICVCVSGPCRCERFDDPLVARLVEALAQQVRVHYADPFSFNANRIRLTYKGDESEAARDRACFDLLVECGRMTKDGDVYKWSAS